MSNINYIKVPYSEEEEEFERFVENFSQTEDEKAKATFIKQNIKAIKDAYEKALLVTLWPDMWKKLENTDSWKTTDEEKIEKAIEQNRTARNIDNVLKEFRSGIVRAPIVASYDKNKRLVLIAGNTRLMIARAYNFRPKIVLVELPDW